MHHFQKHCYGKLHSIQKEAVVDVVEKQEVETVKSLPTMQQKGSIDNNHSVFSASVDRDNMEVGFPFVSVIF